MQWIYLKEEGGRQLYGGEILVGEPQEALDYQKEVFYPTGHEEPLKNLVGKGHEQNYLGSINEHY